MGAKSSALRAFFDGLLVALRGGSSAVRDRYASTGGRSPNDWGRFGVRAALAGVSIDVSDLEPDREARGTRVEILNGLNGTTLRRSNEERANPVVKVPTGLWRFAFKDERNKVTSDQWVLVVSQPGLEGARARISVATEIAESWTGERVNDSRRALVIAVMAGLAVDAGAK
jgi:hypothetical protein